MGTVGGRNQEWRVRRGKCRIKQMEEKLTRLFHSHQEVEV